MRSQPRERNRQHAEFDRAVDRATMPGALGQRAVNVGVQQLLIALAFVVPIVGGAVIVHGLVGRERRPPVEPTTPAQAVRSGEEPTAAAQAPAAEAPKRGGNLYERVRIARERAAVAASDYRKTPPTWSGVTEQARAVYEASSWIAAADVLVDHFTNDREEREKAFLFYDKAIQAAGGDAELRHRIDERVERARRIFDATP